MLSLLALALAEEGPERPNTWSGVVVPLIGANSQDGFGLGLGGEIFMRPREMEEGYVLKLTGSLWATTSLGYTSDYLQVDYRGRSDWLGRAGFRGWTDHAFVGLGGDRVELDPTDAEIGNAVYGPFAFLGASRAIRGDLSWFAQGSYRTYIVDADPDGLLAELAPPGWEGGTYVDVTVGLEHDSTDRWPMPRDGVRAEVSGRLGISALRGGTGGPVAGGNAEVIAWRSLGRHLVVGGRAVVDRAVGPRPFFEANIAGGRWRDELGSEQMFSGYGRTRSRGDGLAAAMVEIRPYLFRTNHSFLDFEFHASFFAEQGWLFRGGHAGPPLPTVGFAPQVLFQGAIQCRPFVAWGWRRNGEDAERRAVPQFGISFLDPL